MGERKRGRRAASLTKDGELRLPLKSMLPLRLTRGNQAVVHRYTFKIRLRLVVVSELRTSTASTKHLRCCSIERRQVCRLSNWMMTVMRLWVMDF